MDVESQNQNVEPAPRKKTSVENLVARMEMMVLLATVAGAVPIFIFLVGLTLGLAAGTARFDIGIIATFFFVGFVIAALWKMKDAVVVALEIAKPGVTGTN